MPVSDLSAATQDYLKCVWTLQEWQTEPVSMTALAERLGVRTSTASDGVKKLAEQGLVDHVAYGGVTLTDEGRSHAVAMVRRHRLIETYLVQQLGYDWDEVHDEAEVLEHAVSDRMVDAIDALLGYPVRDPHGDPIPSPTGAAHRPDALPLSLVGGGEVTVARLSDADPDRLRHFARNGLVLDAVLTVDRAARSGAERATGDPSVTVRIGSGPALSLSLTDADAVWVMRR